MHHVSKAFLVLALAFHGAHAVAKNDGRSATLAASTTTSARSGSAAELTATARYGEPSSTMTIAPTVAILSGKVGFGGMLSSMFRAAPGLYVGIESGFIHFGGLGSVYGSGESSVSITGSLNLIPLTGTLLYKIDTGSAVRPYVGIGVGAVMALTSISAGGSSASRTDFFFTAVARPGVEFELAPAFALGIEPKVGIIDGSFLFQPQMGLTFGL